MTQEEISALTMFADTFYQNLVNVLCTCVMYGASSYFYLSIDPWYCIRTVYTLISDSSVYVLVRRSLESPYYLDGYLAYRYLPTAYLFAGRNQSKHIRKLYSLFSSPFSSLAPGIGLIALLHLFQSFTLDWCIPKIRLIYLQTSLLRWMPLGICSHFHSGDLL